MTNQQSKPPKGGRDFYRAQQKQKRWWLKTMLKTKKPQDALREKLVLYWHNHLCSGQQKVVNSSYETGYMPIQNGLFRRFAAGNYRDLVREFNRDPANLYYLDGILKVTGSATTDIQARGFPLRVGVDGQLQQGFSGKLDDLRIYNRALTQTEIQQDMARPVALP